MGSSDRRGTWVPLVVARDTLARKLSFRESALARRTLVAKGTGRELACSARCSSFGPTASCATRICRRTRADARICSYECTFCSGVRRRQCSTTSARTAAAASSRVRSGRSARGATGTGLANDPPGDTRRLSSYGRDEIDAFVGRSARFRRGALARAGFQGEHARGGLANASPKRRVGLRDCQAGGRTRADRSRDRSGAGGRRRHEPRARPPARASPSRVTPALRASPSRRRRQSRARRGGDRR